MKKLKKYFVVLIMSIVCLFTIAMPIYAEDYVKNIEETKANGESLPAGWIVDGDGNYSNPTTGEYFRWTMNNQRGTVAKSFEFYIRYSVESEAFTIDSTSVKVSCGAALVDKYGQVHADESLDYEVSIKGIFKRTLNFNTHGTESGTINNLIKGGTYTVYIGTSGTMPLDKDGEPLYLSGSGTITNN